MLCKHNHKNATLSSFPLNSHQWATEEHQEGEYGVCLRESVHTRFQAGEELGGRVLGGGEGAFTLA